MSTMFDRAQMMCRGEVPPPPVAALIGFTLTSITPGRATIAFEASERHGNPMGTLQGLPKPTFWRISRFSTNDHVMM